MKPCSMYKDHSVVYVCKGGVNCGERAGGEVCKTREKWLKLSSLSHFAFPRMAIPQIRVCIDKYL